MGTHEAIISPIPGKAPESIGSRCAMVGNAADMEYLCGLMQVPPNQSRRLLLSRLLYSHDHSPVFSMIGPFIGAPYAVLLLETAISWGIKEVIFWGWCGAISPGVHIGDFVIPDTALIDEGTSKNYIHEKSTQIKPSLILQDRLKKRLNSKNIHFHEGPVWTTDAIFRETPEKVGYYQDKNILAVEMESSALFSIGHFRSIPVGCILVVSDEVSTFQWVKGFGSPQFKKARKQAAEVIRDFLTDTAY